MEKDGPSPRDEPPVAAQSRPADKWANGAAYETFMGCWSRLVAREFLRWLAIAPHSRWLDVGCGTGVLTQTILQVAQPAAVQAVDRAAGYISFARTQVRDPRVQFEIADVQQLAVEPAAYDAIVGGLMLNFLPDPEQALGAMLRAAREGGTVAAYVWDYAEGMQFLRAFWNAAVALNPQVAELDEVRRFPLCRPEPLAALFRNAGVQQVDVRAIDIPTDFATFDAFWEPFLGGQGPAASYVASLSEDRRLTLREHLRQSLPIARDGSVALTARAWAVRGTR